MLKMTEETTVSKSMEQHFKIVINNKEIYVNKWYQLDELGTDGDTEIFKGKDLLTEEEQEEVINFVNELL